MLLAPPKAALPIPCAFRLCDLRFALYGLALLALLLAWHGDAHAVLRLRGSAAALLAQAAVLLWLVELLKGKTLWVAARAEILPLLALVAWTGASCLLAREPLPAWRHAMELASACALAVCFSLDLRQRHVSRRALALFLAALCIAGAALSLALPPAPARGAYAPASALLRPLALLVPLLAALAVARAGRASGALCLLAGASLYGAALRLEDYLAAGLAALGLAASGGLFFWRPLRGDRQGEYNWKVPGALLFVLAVGLLGLAGDRLLEAKEPRQLSVTLPRTQEGEIQWERIAFGAGPDAMRASGKRGALPDSPEWLRVGGEFGWGGLALLAAASFLWMRTLFRRARQGETERRIASAAFLAALSMAAAGGLFGTILRDPLTLVLLAAICLAPMWQEEALEPSDTLRLKLEYRWGTVDLLAYGMRKLHRVGLTLKAPPFVAWLLFAAGALLAAGACLLALYAR